MHSFKDTSGQLWTIDITIDAARRVKAELGADLLNPTSGDPPLHTRLGTDDFLLVDTVFAILQPDAKALGVSDEDFGRRLGGDACLRMAEAFWSAWLDFFQSRGRSDLAAVLKKQAELVAATVKLAADRANRIDPLATAGRLMDGISSGNTPESLVFTPEAGPSAA